MVKAVMIVKCDGEVENDGEGSDDSEIVMVK